MNTAIIRNLVIAAVALTLLAGCGPKRVRGEAPFVQVNSWRIDGTDLFMDVRVRNVNDEPLPMSGIEFSVTLDETELVAYQGQHPVDVSANGFETLKLEMTASDAGTDLLAQLQAGDVGSLPYDFSGSVISQDDKKYRFRRDGHIYTVPGRPGQFR